MSAGGDFCVVFLRPSIYNALVQERKLLPACESNPTCTKKFESKVKGWGGEVVGEDLAVCLSRGTEETDQNTKKDQVQFPSVHWTCANIVQNPLSKGCLLAEKSV